MTELNWYPHRGGFKSDLPSGGFAGVGRLHDGIRWWVCFKPGDESVPVKHGYAETHELAKAAAEAAA